MPQDSALFAVDPPQGEAQACDRCSVTAWASIDGLRVIGWIAYDGTSHSGKALRVRVCPSCQRSVTATRSAAPRPAAELPPTLL